MQIETLLAMSDFVPLPSCAFDIAVSRLAPHHFLNLQASVHEIARLVRPGGFVGIIDLHGYEDSNLDDLNHELEVLHDPTHVRSHKPSSWRDALIGAGLEIVFFETHQRESVTGISVHRWCEIAASGHVAELAIRSILAAAPAATLSALGIDHVSDQPEFLHPSADTIGGCSQARRK